MKLLMLYTERFAYRTGARGLDSAAELDEEREVLDALVGLVHAEAADEEEPGRVATKLVKNLKWAARKNGTRTIVLHSFSHLAESKASPDVTRALLDGVEARLREAGYAPLQTPFGYFLDLDLRAPGRSTARLFASF